MNLNSKFHKLKFGILNIGILKCYDGSTKNKGWSNPTGALYRQPFCQIEAAHENPMLF
jgi:hypothetical protein